MIPPPLIDAPVDAEPEEGALVVCLHCLAPAGRIDPARIGFAALVPHPIMARRHECDTPSAAAASRRFPLWDFPACPGSGSALRRLS